jgi:alkanesulfonate monooxygenase SsuD/methylene tetrahydromethanopterin reductase-like flavin-dependent oxidoreductase (luciferase family)
VPRRNAVSALATYIVNVRLSTVILPMERWPASREKWRRAEELGFHAAYTYDHLSWLRLRDRPWFGAVPTLAAAALATSRLCLGPLVTTPNFRHPVPLAKDLLSLDDLAGGRLIVGVGAGGLGADTDVLGEPRWSLRERTDRFGEFVALLDALLSEPTTTSTGTYYSAREALMLPGTVQHPRPPFVVSATGPRGMALAARYAQGWVTTGRGANADEHCRDVVAQELARLDVALDDADRARDSIDTLLLDGLNDERPLVSLDAFVDWAGRYEQLGITELIIHWPEPDSLFAADVNVFEEIATHGLTQL